ncbi:unnamed protein product [Aspergillus oryzae]|nr:unnamed protein product [Aspergillus oryzae]
MIFPLYFGLATITASLASPVSQPLPTAIIDSGAIVGTTTALPSSTAVVRQYLGVPFGAPPVRFSPPEPVARWSTFYNATQWGTACIQQIGHSGKELFGMLDLPPPANGEGEDCLNLNVFTPEAASAGSKAVLVWFYGGSYMNGATSVNLYDGTSFAANQDVVCLRKAPALELKQFAENASLSFGPVPDGGVTLSATPRLDRLYSSEGNSSIARVPILIGNNADEPKPYIRGVNDTKAYLETLGLGEYVDMVLEVYPLGQPGAHNENDRLSLIATDLLMHCPSKVLADDSAKVGIPSYRYFFNASFPNNEAFPGSGAFHAAEIGFVFGTYPKENATQFEHEVSQAMQKAWADFAKDPSQGPGWGKGPMIGVFGDGVKAGMSDVGKKALVAVDSTIMDRRCELYKPLYDQLVLSSSS